MRTVILLCRHEDEAGSFGFVLNSRLPQTLGEILPSLMGIDFPVYRGGPVQLDTLHYIHQYPHLLPESQKITDDIYWGGDFETLKLLLREGSIAKEKIRFFLGYSGWETGQLESEMEERSWLTVAAKPNIIFDLQAEEVWKASLVQLGGKYELMIHFPTDPQLN